MKTRLFTRVLVLIMSILIFSGMTAAFGEEVRRPMDVDGGKWVARYADYLDEHYWEYPYTPEILLLDLDLDCIPELLIISEWGRWSNGGYIVKLTGNEGTDAIEYYSSDLIETCTLALAVDKDGSCGWYQEAFSAGTGLSDTVVRTLRVQEDMTPIFTDWFSKGEQEIYNEDTDYCEWSDNYYQVRGQKVDYAAYRKELIKRRQLKVLYGARAFFVYPDGWENAIREYSVLSPN